MSTLLKSAKLSPNMLAAFSDIVAATDKDENGRCHYPASVSLLALERRGLVAMRDNESGGPDPIVVLTLAGRDLAREVVGEAVPRGGAPRTDMRVAATPVEAAEEEAADDGTCDAQGLRMSCPGCYRCDVSLLGESPAAVDTGSVTLTTEIEYTSTVHTLVWLCCYGPSVATARVHGSTTRLSYKFFGEGHRTHAQAFAAAVGRTFASASEAITAIDNARDTNLVGKSKVYSGGELVFAAAIIAAAAWQVTPCVLCGVSTPHLVCNRAADDSETPVFDRAVARLSQPRTAVKPEPDASYHDCSYRRTDGALPCDVCGAGRKVPVVAPGFDLAALQADIVRTAKPAAELTPAELAKAPVVDAVTAKSGSGRLLAVLPRHHGRRGLPVIVDAPRHGLQRVPGRLVQRTDAKTDEETWTWTPATA